MYYLQESLWHIYKQNFCVNKSYDLLNVFDWTAFVSGEQEGLLLEKVFQIGETLKEGCHLDIAAELQLVESVKAELTHSTNGKSEQTEKITMKKLGLKRSKNIYNSWIFIYVSKDINFLLWHLILTCETCSFC